MTMNWFIVNWLNEISKFEADFLIMMKHIPLQKCHRVMNKMQNTSADKRNRYLLMYMLSTMHANPIVDDSRKSKPEVIKFYNTEKSGEMRLIQC